MKRIYLPTPVLAVLIFLLSACSQPLISNADREPDLTAQFDSTTLDVASGVASYSNGTYVVGLSYTGDGGDPVVLKVNRRGDLLWRRQFSTPDRDQATHVATDSQDNAYVLGETYGNLAQPVRGETDLFLRKYSASGRNLWTRQFGLDKTDYPWDIEVSGNSVYVLGLNNEIGAALYRFNKKSGGTWWKKTFTDVVSNFAVDGSGNLYLASETIAACDAEGGSCQYAVVKKLNSFGRVVWSKTMRLGEPGETARNFRFRDVTLYGSSLYLIGDAYGGTSSEHPAYLVKMDTTGAVKWQQRIGLWEGYGANYSYFFSTNFGLSADGTGVYAKAVTQYNSSSETNYSYAKYGLGGTRLWKVGSDGYRSDSFIYGSLNALDAGADNTLYLAGYVNVGRNGAFLKRVNPATGAVIWSR